jgi:type IV pilus assembly protein PilX
MSLFPALIFLLVLAVLGVAAMSGTVMEERMVGNTKDSNLAFQAAESGLRDAESDISNNVTPATVFTSACTNGFCTPPSTWPTPTSNDISKLIDWSSGATTRTYGVHTNSAALPQVAVQPVYVIERLAALPVAAGGSVGLGVAPPPTGGTAYRITVLATGARAETRVILQSTYVVRQS